MSAALFRGIKEYISISESVLYTRYSAAHTKDICMVMTACHLGAKVVAYNRCANALDLVRRHGNTDSRSTAKNTKLALAADNRVCYLAGVNGIINAVLTVSAEILVSTALFVKVFFYGGYQVKAAVIASKR